MSPAHPNNVGGVPSPPDENSTGLPVLRTWRAVYAVVIGTFVMWVVLLTILTGHYS